MQVVLVYLQPFRRNLLLECALQPEIAKKITKNPFWGVQGRSRLSMLINLKSLSPACLFLSATVFTLHEIIAVKYPLFRGVAAVFDARLRRPPWTRGSGLELLKSTLNAENFIHRLFWSISSHFVTVQCWNARFIQKLRKTSLWGVQGRSRLSMLINPNSLSPVLVMISSTYVPICKRFHIIRANNGKMTSF